MLAVIPHAFDENDVIDASDDRSMPPIPSLSRRARAISGCPVIPYVTAVFSSSTASWLAANGLNSDSPGNHRRCPRRVEEAKRNMQSNAEQMLAAAIDAVRAQVLAELTAQQHTQSVAPQRRLLTAAQAGEYMGKTEAAIS